MRIINNELTSTKNYLIEAVDVHNYRDGLLLFENQNFLLAPCFDNIVDYNRRNGNHNNAASDEEYPPINAKDLLRLIGLT